MQTSVFNSFHIQLQDLSRLGRGWTISRSSQPSWWPWSSPSLLASWWGSSSHFLPRTRNEVNIQGHPAMLPTFGPSSSHHLSDSVAFFSPTASETIPKKKQLVSNCWNVGMKYSVIKPRINPQEEGGSTRGTYIGRHWDVLWESQLPTSRPPWSSRALPRLQLQLRDSQSVHHPQGIVAKGCLLESIHPKCCFSSASAAKTQEHLLWMLNDRF